MRVQTSKRIVNVVDGAAMCGDFLVTTHNAPVFEVFPAHGRDAPMKEFDNLETAVKWAHEANRSLVHIIKTEKSSQGSYTVEIHHPDGSVIYPIGYEARAINKSHAVRLARRLKEIYLPDTAEIVI
jgi:hypothetical protein